MKNRIGHWRRTALLAAGIFASMLSTLRAATPVLYERHSTGSVWGYTNVPCNGQVCSGWEMLDDESGTVQIAAGNGTLYQRQNNGSIWQWNGTVCNGNACNRWTQIGAGASQLWAAGANVYEYTNSGLYQYHGPACSNSITCPGWTQIDNDPSAENYYFQDFTVLKLAIDIYGDDQTFSQYTFQPCVGGDCPGWSIFGFAPYASGPPLALAPGLAAWYEVGSNGAISVYGPPCGNEACTWAQIGDNTNTVQITAGNGMYQLQSNGAVLQYTGTACNGDTCNGWLQLDQNAAISYIIAGENTVYEQHTNGSIWQYTGKWCNLCSGWTELDNNPLTVSVVPGY
jgi:hypothetical protein